jgi:hypothetical protein
MAVGQEVLIKSRPDQVGQRHPVLQAGRERDRVGSHQACTARTVLAPVDEHLAQAPVIALVGRDREPLQADGHGHGVPAAPRWQLLPHT